MAESINPTPPGPDGQALLQLAVAQAGLFTTAQAAEVGFSPELLIHHVKRGRLARSRRGIYRVKHLPPQGDEQLVELWLWSRREGVLSHRTALALFDLSDVLPAEVEMTVPTAWNGRRLRVPEPLRLHHADLEPEERQWVGHVPVTTPHRTLHDCIVTLVERDLVHQAIDQALAQGRLLDQEAHALREAAS